MKQEIWRPISHPVGGALVGASCFVLWAILLGVDTLRSAAPEGIAALPLKGAIIWSLIAGFTYWPVAWIMEVVFDLKRGQVISRLALGGVFLFAVLGALAIGYVALRLCGVQQTDTAFAIAMVVGAAFTGLNVETRKA